MPFPRHGRPTRRKTARPKGPVASRRSRGILVQAFRRSDRCGGWGCRGSQPGHKQAVGGAGVLGVRNPRLFAWNRPAASAVSGCEAKAEREPTLREIAGGRTSTARECPQHPRTPIKKGTKQQTTHSENPFKYPFTPERVVNGLRNDYANGFAAVSALFVRRGGSYLSLDLPQRESTNYWIVQETTGPASQRSFSWLRIQENSL